MTIDKLSASSQVAGYLQGRKGRRPIRVDKLLAKLEKESEIQKLSFVPSTLLAVPRAAAKKRIVKRKRAVPAQMQQMPKVALSFVPGTDPAVARAISEERARDPEGWRKKYLPNSSSMIQLRKGRQAESKADKDVRHAAKRVLQSKRKQASMVPPLVHQLALDILGTLGR